MMVTMELSEGETLRCDTCRAIFHGAAYLNIDEGDESVEAVYCTTCIPQSSSTTARNKNGI